MGIGNDSELLVVGKWLKLARVNFSSFLFIQAESSIIHIYILDLHIPHTSLQNNFCLFSIEKSLLTGYVKLVRI